MPEGIQKMIKRYGGTSSIREIDVRKLYATRPFLRTKKLADAKRGVPSKRPQIALVCGLGFILDGRHRIKEALIGGRYRRKVIVFESNNRRLLQALQRKSDGRTIDQITDWTK